jgi:hypothetical protein
MEAKVAELEKEVEYWKEQWKISALNNYHKLQIIGSLEIDLKRKNELIAKLEVAIRVRMEAKNKIADLEEATLVTANAEKKNARKRASSVELEPKDQEMIGLSDVDIDDIIPAICVCEQIMTDWFNASFVITGYENDYVQIKNVRQYLEHSAEGAQLLRSAITMVDLKRIFKICIEANGIKVHKCKFYKRRKISNVAFGVKFKYY